MNSGRNKQLNETKQKKKEGLRFVIYKVFKNTCMGMYNLDLNMNKIFLMVSIVVYCLFCKRSLSLKFVGNWFARYFNFICRRERRKEKKRKRQTKTKKKKENVSILFQQNFLFLASLF